ncbi:hypothetical protein STENM223S_02539 [Streptomyces tendae]
MRARKRATSSPIVVAASSPASSRFRLRDWTIEDGDAQDQGATVVHVKPPAESALLGSGPRQASVLTPGSTLPLAFPRGAQWRVEGCTPRSQWRDRAGFTPASCFPSRAMTR